MVIDNEKLRLALADNQMMLKDLCEKANISETAFRSIRKGESTPRPATIGRIAKALGVGVRDIIQEGDDNGSV